jgi:hypothetical protein
MKQRLIFASMFALATVLTVAPATAERHYYSFTCSNNTLLRVVFDDDHNSVAVNRIRQPVVRLTRTQGGQGTFRYVRGDNYELSGSMEEVQWRVGHAQWTCPRGG